MHTIGDTIAAPYKVAFTLEKYTQREPDGNPDAVEGSEQWYEADGTEISDPARVAELEAGIARQEGVTNGADQCDA